MKTILKLVLFLLPMTVLAQSPQIPLTGNIGSGFNGPLINSPAVIFATDADHTMVYPEMSGSGGTIIVTSAPSLTATRNLIAPNTGIFNWVVRNNTTGGQSINVKVSGGTGVSIANGDSSVVMCDTVNCYVPGGQSVTQFLAPSASWPSWLVPTVTNQYTTPSLAVTAAYTPLSAVTGTAPVVATPSGSTVAISMPVATTSVDGYLSSTDWTTFNSKQAALTNPVTGPGSATANDAATFTGTGDQVQDSGVTISWFGSDNANIGGSLPSTASGAGNTAVGKYALLDDTTGYGNTALGWGTLPYNTTGIDNTASGHDSLNQNTTGNYNTAYGVSALNKNTTGNYNTAVGSGSLTDGQTVNSYNTAIGHDSFHTASGSDNVAVGYSTNPQSAPDSNEIVIGASTTGAGSNTATIGNASVTDEYFGSVAGLAILHGAAFTGNSATATNLSTSGTANQVWGMNSGATAQGWQTPGSTMTYPGANTIGVANSGNTAWRTPLYSDITGLFGSGSCSGLLKSDGTCVLASTLNVSYASSAGSAANITATSNSTITTLPSLSLPYSQVSGTPSAYVLPTATSTVLGGVKPDGTSILNTAGAISATAASVGADASGAAAARAAVGNCSAGQYGTATTTSGLTCAQVAYSQVSGTPSIPTVGTWGALNYPTWASGTPFVKMTAAGTFALDTNTYLTSSGVSGMTAGQVPIAATATTVTSSKALAGSASGITTGPTSSTNGDLMSFTGTGGQAADSGIAASNVPLLNATTNTYTGIGAYTTTTNDCSGGWHVSSTASGAATMIGCESGSGGIGDLGGPFPYTSNIVDFATNGIALWSYVGPVRIASGSSATVGLTVSSTVVTPNLPLANSTQINNAGGTPENPCLADGTGGGVCGTSTPAFSAITSATNTRASMVVGTGGSLGVSGSGTISANVLAGNGVTNTAVASLGTGSLAAGSCTNGGATAVTGTTASSVVTASLSATAAVILAAPAQGIVVTALLSTDTHVPAFYVCNTSLTSWTYTGYSVAMQVH